MMPTLSLPLSDITVMSLSGKLNVGLISCQRLVDDLWGLADRFEFELAELTRTRV